MVFKKRKQKINTTKKALKKGLVTAPLLFLHQAYFGYFLNPHQQQANNNYTCQLLHKIVFCCSYLLPLFHFIVKLNLDIFQTFFGFLNITNTIKNGIIKTAIIHAISVNIT